jgi:L-threonylcarbamoyladenylate synthase
MDLETLGQLLSLSPFQGSFKGPGGPILKSPGQLESHYAPTHRVYLNASTAAPQEGFLTFGPPPPHEAAAVQHLSLSGDLTEAAANFFPMLHLLDKEKVTCLRVMPIPNQGLGQAINDRLRRQAVERNEAPSQA